MTMLHFIGGLTIASIIATAIVYALASGLKYQGRTQREKIGTR